jgi:AraC family transcriptional regulator
VSDTLRRVQRAIDFVEAHLFEELPLTAIAERGSCSPWHFHRLFVALTGETPATYVWKRRLSEICRRLIETRHPLVDVALHCGFESQATFTRACPHICIRRSTCARSSSASTGWTSWRHASCARQPLT